ncbi:MAG: hypothetical protein ACRERD_29785 [Candidatus Binatia bacterium]
MNDSTPAPPQVGLCADCRYRREIVSGKGSRFFYCLRAETDMQYPRYPRLPVLHCTGYQTEPRGRTET